MRRALILTTLLAAASARADDGVYVKESFGVGKARGQLEPIVGNAMHSRLGVGWRWRWLAIEPWLGSDLQLDREGAFRGFVGGEPADGRADLTQFGADLKLIAPLHRSGPVIVEGYLRGGASYASTNGALSDYSGHALGAGAGVQLKGRVRALGFLWAPLFWVKRGPMVTGALYFDQGYEFVDLHRAGSMPVSARVGNVSVGFAIGSAF